MKLIRPALLVHDFERWPADGNPDEAITRWTALRSGLHMDRSDSAEPESSPPDEMTVLRWAERHRADLRSPLYESALWSTGDDLCLSTLLAPNSDSTSWPDLEAELAAAGLGDVQELGGARVYLALLDRPPTEPDFPELVRAVSDALPDDYDWSQRWTLTRQNFVMWELRARPGGIRRLVLLAYQDDEGALDTFAWSPGDRDVGLLSKYLLDAAKLRDRDRAHRILGPEVTTLIDDTDRAAAELSAQQGSVTATSRELTTASTELARIRLQAGGLGEKASFLQKLGHDVAAAMINIRANVPVRAEAQGPVAADVALAAQIRERIDHDISRVRDTTANADRVADATAIVVQRGLSLNETRINVVQGSLIGAILMVLGAIQALQPKLDRVPPGFRWPLIVMLGSLALALPNVLFRLSRSAPRDLPLKVFDYGTMLAAAAGIAWVTAQLVNYYCVTSHQFLGVKGVLAWVAGGLLVAAISERLISGRRR